MKHLRKRFIVFNIIVISSIMFIFTILVSLSKQSTLSLNKLYLTIGVIVGLVFISSWILSKIAIGPIKTAWQKQLDFTADASHELRTPLTTIQTNLDLVLSAPKATVESQKKWLENIRIENNRMNILLSNLLLLSRADTNEAIIKFDKLNLSSLVSEVIQTYCSVAEQYHLTLTSTIEEKIMIRGDKDRLKQLLIILIDNAIKYNTPDGKINITATVFECYAKIKVSDTGIGLTTEEVMRVFERFYRGKQSRIYNSDGSGLGLAIAKLIAEEHGGQILVESQYQKGSVFKILIPINLK